ncbi:MAG: WD40 repeat domain-containing protein [Cyanobacteriota bacterium]|nr:WD40 repeat domain-containing protein [Cyanobacteriota bacterium]
MAKKSNQPREYDAVLGGQVPLPVDSAILGDIEGVKRRLASAVEEQQITALNEALKYGEAGLDLVILALQDKSLRVEGAAYRLLRKRGEPRVKQALREYKPWRLFKCLHTFGGHSSLVDAFVISSDGQTLVSDSSDGIIKVWNLQTGELRNTLIGYSGSVKSVVISSDGQTLVSASNVGTVKVWNLYTGELRSTLQYNSIQMYGYSDRSSIFVISPDGNTLVNGTRDGTINVWDLRTKKLRGILQTDLGEVKSVAISPDGQTLVSSSNNGIITVWNLHTGQLRSTLQGDSYGWGQSLTISPDGQTLVSGKRSSTIKVWNLHTGELRSTMLECYYLLESLTICPDGQTIVSGSNREIKVWGVR